MISPARTSSCCSSLEAAGARLAPYPASVAYRDRMHARPAYKRALDRGGPYQLMGR